LLAIFDRTALIIMGVCGTKTAVTVHHPAPAKQTDVRVDAGNVTGALHTTLLDLKKVRKVRCLNLEKSGLFNRRRECEREKQQVETPCTAALEPLCGES